MEKEKYLEPVLDRIEQIMDAKHLRRAEFAQETNIVPQKISTLLNRKYYPSLIMVIKTLVAYKDISPQWLLLGVGSMYSHRNDEDESNEKEIDMLKRELSMIKEQLNTYKELYEIYKTKATEKNDAQKV